MAELEDQVLPGSETLNINKIYSSQLFIRIPETRHWLSAVALAVLTGCPVSSTSVSDDNLIAQFLVQNDNGRNKAMVTLGIRDQAGYNEVNLEADESVSYQRNAVTNAPANALTNAPVNANTDDAAIEQGAELRKQDDGEYAADLPADAAGWYSFTLVRESNDRFRNDREIDNNHVYLPNDFAGLLAQAVQSGPAINVSWIADNTQQFIDQFSTTGSVDTFNALAICQNETGEFDLAMTEGSITEQNEQIELEIPVADHLAQVLQLTAESIAATTCEFDIQLVRNQSGTTDVGLDNRSTATGQLLKNVAVQWSAQ